jgi:Tol biopolymer transport system component
MSSREDEVERICQAALDRPPVERDQFVLDVCRGDEALRREVASRLAYADAASRFLERPALDIAAQALAGHHTLIAGQRIGAYVVTGCIGAGGMGEVYRARDSALGRDVAIKVLPAILTSDRERLARFEREARVLAALNHPNVATIHGIEPIDGGHALILEVVDGETLDERLVARGPLPSAEALGIARQIADALEAAHEQGIVHRDLKPSNIKIRSDGLVKVLDFGLAKQAHSYDSDAETEATRPAVTHVGTVMGTAAYMSPEQATGHAADRRADVWAFGVVLFEMLTGRRPFAGDTTTAILANVIGAVPDLAGLPAHLRGIIEKCLRKDPRTRWQWIGDVRLALDESPTATAASLAPLHPARARVMTWALASVAALCALGFAVMALLYVGRDEAPRLTTTRFTVPIPGDDRESARFELSPNGRLLAIAAIEKGKRRLWVRALDSLEARLLAGTDGAEMPFWSADSTQIGFFANGRLMRVPVTEGPPVLVAQVGPQFSGASWNADGVIVFSSSPNMPVGGALSRVQGTGGSVAPIRIDNVDNGYFPRFLPDGKRFLFRGNRAKGTESGIWLGTLDDPRAQLLAADFTNAAYVPSPDRRGPGRLLSARARSLISRSFDEDTLRVGTDVSTVAELLAGQTGRWDFSASDHGDLAYRQATLFQLTWVSRSGVSIGEVGSPGIEWAPGGALGTARLSPDETKVAYARQHDEQGRANSEVWQLELSRNVSERLTFFPGPDLVPVWSPNSKEIVFTSNRDEATSFDPYVVSPGNRERVLTKVPGGGWPLDWSPDGRIILLAQGGRLWTVGADGTALTPILDSTSDFARISPDGRWLAYISTGSGLTDVYMRPFAASGSARRVSGAGGTEPQWRRDGRELFYVAGDGTLMAVPVATDGALGRPAPLFAAANGYQAAGDGQRFLVPRRVASDGAITIVLNSQ